MRTAEEVRPSPLESPPASRRELLWYGLLFGGLFALIVWLVLTYELVPGPKPSPPVPFHSGRTTHRESIGAYIALTSIGMVGILAWGWLRRRAKGDGRWLRRTGQVMLTLLVFTAGFSYFYGRRGLGLTHFSHRWDTFHYLLGPRYYAEVDYADLYACALEDISTRDVPDTTAVRDLSTYRMSTAGDVRAEQRCADNFTPERRERWRADLELFTGGDGRGTLRDLLGDRGYNGSPFHSAVAGVIADHIPLTVATHQMVPLLDVGLTCLMCFAVASAFGWQVGLVFALFFFTDAADRWGIIGGSYFRYVWMVTLTMGLVGLRRGRHAFAGVMMALSTLLNLFPVVFAAGVAVRAAVTGVRERRLLPQYRRFFVAAILTGVIGLGIGAIPARGIGNYTSFAADMELHGVERFQGFGTGLKFPFVFRGGVTAQTDKVSERTRKKWFHEVRPWYRGLATVVIGLALGIAARTDDDVEAAAVLGFTLFFGVLGTVGYYFACAAVMVLALHRWVDSRGGRWLLSLFFLTSLLAHIALYATLYYRFMYNTVLSTGWSLWLIGLLVWLAARRGVFQWLRHASGSVRARLGRSTTSSAAG